MNPNTNDTQRLLYARAADLLRQADRGELAISNFLTPAESAYLTVCFSQMTAGERVLLFGGYEDAERRIAFVLPSYLCDLDGDAREKLEAYFPDELSGSIRAIRVRGSGYRTLTHRDYLGTILSLGVERHSIGDIVVEDEHSAVIFCTGKIFSYLCESIDRIAADKITLSELVIDGSFRSHPALMPMSVTVASERFDCAVGALTNLSREKAQELIRAGLCALNHLEELRCDKNIEPPCIISVRGHGKFAVREFGGETRRGRLRLLADKYV